MFIPEKIERTTDHYGRVNCTLFHCSDRRWPGPRSDDSNVTWHDSMFLQEISQEKVCWRSKRSDADLLTRQICDLTDFLSGLRSDDQREWQSRIKHQEPT